MGCYGERIEQKRVDRGTGKAGPEKQARLAVALLKNLLRGQRIIADDGRLWLGSKDVTALVKSLLEQDLLEYDGENYGVTSPGHAYLRRHAASARKVLSDAQSQAAYHSEFRIQHADFSEIWIDEALAQPLHGRQGRRETGRNIGDSQRKLQKVVINRAESPLAWLHSRRDKNGNPFITLEQLAAGERLRIDFECGGLQPRVTSSWSGIPVEHGRGGQFKLNPTDMQLAARKRYHAAVEALGAGLADIVVRVCCWGQGLEDAERSQGWPARSGKVVLSLGLDRLVKYYGIG